MDPGISIVDWLPELVGKFADGFDYIDFEGAVGFDYIDFEGAVVLPSSSWLIVTMYLETKSVPW